MSSQAEGTPKTPQNKVPSAQEQAVGALLRQHRESLGLGQSVAAKALGYKSTSTISKLENGKQALTFKDVAALCLIYRVNDETRSRYVDMLLEGAQERWWEELQLEQATKRFMSLEAGAAAIKDFSFLVFPGILQTGHYADAVIRSVRTAFTDEQLSQAVEARRRRREILYGKDPKKFHSIIDEAVLLRDFGQPEAMLEQLGLLLEMSVLHNITIQILRLSVVANPGLDGPFTIFEYPEGSPLNTVYTEDQLSQRFGERDKEVDRCRTAFETLSSLASSPEESKAIIQDRLNEIKVKAQEK